MLQSNILCNDYACFVNLFSNSPEAFLDSGHCHDFIRFSCSCVARDTHLVRVNNIDQALMNFGLNLLN